VQALSLAESRRKNPGYRTESLAAIIVGAGKVESEGIARIRAALCRNVISVYGASETGLVGITSFDVLGDRPGVIVFPEADLEIVDEAGRQLPAGEEGLVRFRTPQLRESIEAAAPEQIPAARDGWFNSGDIGSFDKQGILRLVGRSSDVINRGGVKVSGARIEDILKQMPEIRDAAACGVVGASSLEEIWVAVVGNGAIDIDGIKQHLREHADIGIAPDEVFVVDQIPRGDLGKVQKYRLKELLLGLKRGA